jgi:carboxypeptidase T
MHSYSQLVLWSWGFTYDPPPNNTALVTLGRKFAYFNGYEPDQAVGLYPTDGTTDDFAYGELGLAAYTFELGTTFFQDCSTFENQILPDNLEALVYAAKTARAPYMLPAGPDALDLNFECGWGDGGNGRYPDRRLRRYPLRKSERRGTHPGHSGGGVLRRCSSLGRWGGGGGVNGR